MDSSQEMPDTLHFLHRGAEGLDVEDEVPLRRVGAEPSLMHRGLGPRANRPLCNASATRALLRRGDERGQVGPILCLQDDGMVGGAEAYTEEDDEEVPPWAGS